MRLAALLLAILAAACGAAQTSASHCTAHTFENDRFTVCAFDPQTEDLRLAWRSADGTAYRSFAALSREMDTAAVAFVMNAGMYNDAGAPIGLYIENSRELRPISKTDGPGNFHLKPNGVFWVDAAGLPHVDAADSYLAQSPAPVWATQSGPMLLIDGALHPAFEHDGTSRNIRNGVGVNDAGGAWFVISESPVSFGKFARLFRDVLGADDALYLDGAVSGLWAPDLRRMDAGHALGPLVVVTRKPG